MLQILYIRGFVPSFNSLLISHLQFADDTLIFCNVNEDQVKNVNVILLCNEVVSGLKEDFYKSELLGVIVEDSLMSCLANIVGRKVGSFPATYLGLPLRICKAPKSF